jgi:hypothetical protein
VISWFCLVCSAETIQPVIIRDRRGHGSWIVATECTSCESVIYHSKYGDWSFESDSYLKSYWLKRPNIYVCNRGGEFSRRAGNEEDRTWQKTKTKVYWAK